MPRLNPFAGSRAKLTKGWEAHIADHVVSLAWSAPLGVIAAAGAEGPIHLLDAATGKTRHVLPGHGFGTSMVGWSHDGLHLASAGQDGKAHLWDAVTGRCRAEMPGGAAWVEKLAWCRQSPLLATAAGKKLKLWSADGQLLREYADQPSTIADIQWSPKEPILASVCYGAMSWWSPDQSETIRLFPWKGSMLVVAWSPDLKHIATGAQDASVHFWILESGEDREMSGYPMKVREIAWDATGRYLATGGGNIPCVWDFSGKGPVGSRPIQLEAHTGNLNALAFQHQGTYLASGGEDGLLVLWNPSRQQSALSIAKLNAPVTQLAWSADDTHLALGGADGLVAMYATK